MKLKPKLSKAERDKLKEYPKVTLTKEEFKNLPEYSTTNPTQDSSGVGVKRWRRRTPLFFEEEHAIWFLGVIEDDKVKFYHINKII